MVLSCSRNRFSSRAIASNRLMFNNNFEDLESKERKKCAQFKNNDTQHNHNHHYKYYYRHSEVNSVKRREWITENEWAIRCIFVICYDFAKRTKTNCVRAFQQRIANAIQHEKWECEKPFGLFNSGEWHFHTQIKIEINWKSIAFNSTPVFILEWHLPHSRSLAPHFYLNRSVFVCGTIFSLHSSAANNLDTFTIALVIKSFTSVFHSIEEPKWIEMEFFGKIFKKCHSTLNLWLRWYEWCLCFIMAKKHFHGLWAEWLTIWKSQMRSLSS